MAFKKKKTAPVEVEKSNVVDLGAEENEAEMHIESEEKKEFENIYVDTGKPADGSKLNEDLEKLDELPKKGKVEIKEEEYKSVNLLKAPEEIKKIIQFYGLTGKDLFEGKFDGVKEDEAKMLKEWYATLA